MNQKELKELIEFLVEKDIAEFELERGDLKIRVKRPGEAVAPPPTVVHMAPTMAAGQAPVAHAAAQSAPAAPLPSAAPSAPPAEEAGLHIVKSPIVGTYYEAPSPGSPPFLKVGDSVSLGQVLCIVEAMKLMNEIESDMAGEVAKILVKNGQPVEYGQALFAIRSK